MIWHSEERMFTCFGTHEEYRAQQDWYDELADDNHVVVGSYHPFSRGKVLWHVWDEWNETDNLMLYKLTWGGAR